MRRFTNILFSPLGRTDNPAAIRRITELARGNGAKLTLLGTVPEPSRRHRLLHDAEYDAAIEIVERHDMTERLQRWCEAADGVDVEIDTRTGNAALTVIGQVLAAGHDLVVVTSDEDREDHATIKRLLRKCPCPVWVIRPTRARIQRVLVAVDTEPDEIELNHTLLELGAGMVELGGGELHVVHAWELYGESTLRSSAFAAAPRSRVQDLLRAEHDGHLRALNELLSCSTSSNAPWRVHLIKGAPGLVVPELVRHERINLLIMGTVARTGIGGLVMGNTAEQVLDDVRCSVIAVKPPGFTSPIEGRRS
jgi:nucleotide-binding universal stress UspA family protein